LASSVPPELVQGKEIQQSRRHDST